FEVALDVAIFDAPHLFAGGGFLQRLDLELILHADDAGDAAGLSLGGVLHAVGGHDAEQRDDSIGGVDVDFGGGQIRGGEQAQIHLGGDARVGEAGARLGQLVFLGGPVFLFEGALCFAVLLGADDLR